MSSLADFEQVKSNNLAVRLRSLPGRARCRLYSADFDFRRSSRRHRMSCCSRLALSVLLDICYCIQSASMNASIARAAPSCTRRSSSKVPSRCAKCRDG